MRRSFDLTASVQNQFTARDGYALCAEFFGEQSQKLFGLVRAGFERADFDELALIERLAYAFDKFVAYSALTHLKQGVFVCGKRTQFCSLFRCHCISISLSSSPTRFSVTFISLKFVSADAMFSAHSITHTVSFWPK